MNSLTEVKSDISLSLVIEFLRRIGLDKHVEYSYLQGEEAVLVCRTPEAAATISAMLHGHPKGYVSKEHN